MGKWHEKACQGKEIWMANKDEIMIHFSSKQENGN